MRRTPLLLVLLMLAWVEAPQKQCGVSWVAGGSITEKDILPLVECNVGWIVQTPFGWQGRVDTPAIRLVTSGGVFWGETDEGLVTTTELARKHGIKTLLKPHIWIRDQRDGAWRGQIQMMTEGDWARWFDDYRTFILHYAKLAQESGMEALCVGTELHRTVVLREDDWRRIIADVRDVYDGKLTYAANWHAEFEDVPFWDALDYVGIQAYFPLSDDVEPTVESLRAGWRRHAERIDALRKRVGKPVIFTEIGYCSRPSPAATPWEWPRRADAPVDLESQAHCYSAFFETFWHRDWFAGAYIWKWYPTHDRAGGSKHTGFTPQNKPAQKVITEWYGGVRGTEGRRDEGTK